jgi:hypothetical protein
MYDGGLDDNSGDLLTFEVTGIDVGIGEYLLPLGWYFLEVEETGLVVENDGFLFGNFKDDG